MERNPLYGTKNRSLGGRKNPKPGGEWRFVGPGLVAPGVPFVVAPRGKDRTSELNHCVRQTLGQELPKKANIPVSKYSIKETKQPDFKVVHRLDNGMVILGVTSFKQRLKQSYKLFCFTNPV